ncbi:MAG: hypothetical protein HY235_10735 [Acidobacteria bacterium]|nr:hypothetical protein [Acidobacteriota bacterium]
MPSPITDEKLQNFQSTVGGLLSKATSLANIPIGPTAAIGFAAETVFRLVRLGFAIRRAQLEANKQLSDAVRLEDIPRESIALNLNDAVLENKIRSGEFEAQFPEAAEQFLEEIETFRSNAPLAVPRRTRRLLAFAVRHVPALVRDGRLESPELQHLFGRFLHPLAPDYRRVIGEMEQMLPAPDLDTESHLARTRDSFTRSLELSRLRLNQLTAAEQSELNQAISGLVTDAILGSAGLASKTTDFLVSRKKLQIDEEIESNEAEKAKIPDDQPDAAARRLEISKRIEELRKWKARLG